MEALQLCRGCSKQPRIKGSLYCDHCKGDMDSFIGAAQRQAHAPDGTLCWCPDCTMGEQREFRQREANIRNARELAERASRPPFLDPDPTTPPSRPPKRAA